MRVLFLAHSYPRFATDPIGSFVLRLAVALRDYDVEVMVLAPGSRGVPPRDTFEGIPVERFRYAPRRYETLAYTGSMRQQVRDSWAARAAMASFLVVAFARGLTLRRRFPWQLAHAHWWFPAGVVGAWLKRWTGAPLVTTRRASSSPPATPTVSWKKIVSNLAASASNPPMYMPSSSCAFRPSGPSPAPSPCRSSSCRLAAPRWTSSWASSAARTTT